MMRGSYRIDAHTFVDRVLCSVLSCGCAIGLSDTAWSTLAYPITPLPLPIPIAKDGGVLGARCWVRAIRCGSGIPFRVVPDRPGYWPGIPPRSPIHAGHGTGCAFRQQAELAELMSSFVWPRRQWGVSLIKDVGRVSTEGFIGCRRPCARCPRCGHVSVSVHDCQSSGVGEA